MIHPKMKYTYVGIDLHKQTHTAVLLNCFFEKLGQITFANLPSKFPAFLAEANQCKAEETTLMFGLEDVSAYGRTLTVFLREQGQPVKHVNATLVAGERSNQNVIHKTDSMDAECAARVLLSKMDTLPDATPQDEYWTLRTLVIRRQFIVKNNTSLKNHLHTLITPHYPNYHLFFEDIACPTSLTFLMKYPSPDTLKYTSAEELREFLYEPSAGNVGMTWVQRILDVVKENGTVSTKFQATRDITIQSTIRQLDFNLQELHQLEKTIEEFLIPFHCPLTSIRGIDTITAAKMLSLIGDIHKFSTPAKLARYAGIAPVTKSSGQKDSKFSNQRGNRQLNTLFYGLAVRVSMKVSPANKIINPFFYDYYHKKLSEGKTKRQALKCVQRRLINIVWRMLTDGENYVNPPTMTLAEMKNEGTNKET